MAIQTFTSGQILTASDTNTYLANSGLVYVASGTLSTNITDITTIFSSTYRNYRIVIDSPSVSGAAPFRFRYLTGTNTPTSTGNYFWMLSGVDGGGNAVVVNQNSNAIGSTGWEATAAGGQGAITIDVISPNLAVGTTAIIDTSFAYSSTFRALSGAVNWNLTTQFTGIRILTDSAVTMAGNYTVYGYRTA
jgi:hypothetical protein